MYTVRIGRVQARTTRTHLSARSTNKEHDPGSSVGESGLQEADGHRQGHSGGAQRPHALVHGPGVTLNVPYQVSKVHVNVLQGQQKPTEEGGTVKEGRERGGGTRNGGSGKKKYSQGREGGEGKW